MSKLIIFENARWGESAGAHSVGFHLVLNNGSHDGLFRGAIMVGSLAAKASFHILSDGSRVNRNLGLHTHCETILLVNRTMTPS